MKTIGHHVFFLWSKMIGTGHWQPSSRCPTCCPRFCWPCDSWANYVCRKPSELRCFFLAKWFCIKIQEAQEDSEMLHFSLLFNLARYESIKIIKIIMKHQSISSNIFHLMTCKAIGDSLNFADEPRPRDAEETLLRWGGSTCQDFWWVWTCAEGGKMFKMNYATKFMRIVKVNMYMT